MRIFAILCFGMVIGVGCARDVQRTSAESTSPTGAIPQADVLDGGTKSHPPEDQGDSNGLPVKFDKAMQTEAWDGWELSLSTASASTLLAIVERGPWASNTSSQFAFADYYVPMSSGQEEDWILHVFLPNRTDGVRAHVLLGKEFPVEYRLEAAAADTVYSFFTDLRAHHPLGDDKRDGNAVLGAGDTFEFHNRYGAMKIHADSNRKRTYTWNGASRHVFMKHREKPWYGALGLYFPGPGDHWREHNGVTRGVLLEETQDFQTIEDFLTWFKTQSEAFDSHYTPDGIVAGWSINTERGQLNVTLWQVTIGGKKPTSLKGGTTDWLTWTNADD